MGRRKYCDKLGLEHKYEKVYPSIGGYCDGKAVFRCEWRCSICKHTKPVAGVFTSDDKTDGYKKMPDGWYENGQH